MPSSPPGGLCLCSTPHSHAHRSAGSGPQSAAPRGKRGYLPGPTAQRAPGRDRAPVSSAHPEPRPVLQAAVSLLVLPGPTGDHSSASRYTGYPIFLGRKHSRPRSWGAAELGFPPWPEAAPATPGLHRLSQRWQGPGFYCLHTAAWQPDACESEAGGREALSDRSLRRGGWPRPCHSPAPALGTEGGG